MMVQKCRQNVNIADDTVPKNGAGQNGESFFDFLFLDHDD
jgi:hypothetical protein